VLLFLVAVTNAQTKVDWKEKSDFHTVMSQTFHPVEEGNYQPIKERSAEIVEKANAWLASPIPADFKQIKGIKKNLEKLAKGSEALHNNIKSGYTDEKIKTEGLAVGRVAGSILLHDTGLHVLHQFSAIILL